MDYKDTHIEIGKLVNKEAKAKKQADKLWEKLAKDGKEIKKAIGKDNTFSIMDIQAKDIDQFGPRFGRGSKAIYEGFKLKEDPEAKQAMPKEKFMKDVTVEGADLAFAIGSKILKEFDKNEFPLLISVIDSICNNKKLEINW